jgi:hypothetical protein
MDSGSASEAARADLAVGSPHGRSRGMGNVGEGRRFLHQVSPISLQVVSCLTRVRYAEVVMFALAWIRLSDLRQKGAHVDGLVGAAMKYLEQA